MNNDFNWLYPHGEMAQKIRSKKWESSPLGAPELWPLALKASINSCLASHYPAYVWWGTESIVFYNDAYIALAGSYKHADGLGNPASGMWPEIWPLLQDFIAEVKDTLKPVWRENLLMALERNGVKEEAYFSFSFNPLLDEHGRFSGVNCICSEMTELQISKNLLQDNQNRLQLALRGGDMGTWSIDLATGTFTGDERFNEIHGIPASRLGVEETLAQRFHPEDSERTGKILNEAITGLGVYVSEYRMRQPDGKFRWVYSRGEVQTDENNKPVAMSGISLDIHDKKMIEEDLRRAVSARDEFLSIASHELKTPLTSLKIQSQLLQRLIGRKNPEAYAPERINQFVAQSEKQVLRLTRLVDDMLDVSRIRSEKMSIERGPFDLPTLIQETLTLLRDQFHSARYKVPEFESDANSLEVNWDRLRIEQVLINLLTNAIRYGNKNPIHVRLKAGGEKIRLEVADEGIGIEPQDREKVFDRFERSVNVNEVSGLGLGLFISRQIVRAHDGAIWVEDNGPRKGSRFIVEIPKMEKE